MSQFKGTRRTEQTLDQMLDKNEGLVFIMKASAIKGNS
jgi:hypothetical protein